MDMQTSKLTPPMGELHWANDLLDDREALNAAWELDGYWFFRDVLDKEVIGRIRQTYTDYLLEMGVAEMEGSSPRYNGADVTGLHVHTALTRLNDAKVHKLLHEAPTINVFFAKLFGCDPFWVPFTMHRTNPPVSDHTGHRRWCRSDGRRSVSAAQSHSFWPGRAPASAAAISTWPGPKTPPPASGNAFASAGDASDAKACARLVSEIVARFGRLDILVNNVGISTPTKLETIDDAIWSRIFDVNLKSAMLMSKYSIPEMTKTGGGSIVNISSIAGIRTLGSLAYGTSKAAMAQLAREIAVMHGRDGIRANTVAPGHLMTPHAMHVLPAEMRETRRKIGPLGLEGDAWDVALAVCFLASDEARFITGVELPVDGGVTETGPMAAHALIMRAD